MKVLLVKDVYKLGRAGDVKKVADGYGRNFLLPQKMAVLATSGALKQIVKIRSQAEIRRTEQNSELKDLSNQIKALTLVFAAKAGETRKLYGFITTQDVANAIQEKTRFEVKKQQIDMQPIRNLGETGKLYGSITTQDVANAIQEKTRFEVKKQQIDMQPIRNLGEFIAHVRLTMDLVPEVKIIVHREGEAVEDGAEASAPTPQVPAEVPAQAAETAEA